MKKKIVAIALSLSMCVGMTGCSKTRDGEDNFRCVDNKIFIGNMGTKSSYKGDAQSNDIAHAGKVMDKLERTMRN